MLDWTQSVSSLTQLGKFFHWGKIGEIFPLQGWSGIGTAAQGSGGGPTPGGIYDIEMYHLRTWVSGARLVVGLSG